MDKEEKREQINFIQNSLNVSARMARQLLVEVEDACTFCKQVSDKKVHLRFRKRLLYGNEELSIDRKDFIWESLMGDRK